ncbi:MAG: hypothetical protein ABJN34_04700 [Litoreibacter sp.]|uniref:hypothetical protein n=1 Tax=Litoreibacter sp. TaxID=1969459 RepID=UPI00329A273E
MTLAKLLNRHRSFFDLDYVRQNNLQAVKLSDKELLQALMNPDEVKPFPPNSVFDPEHYTMMRAAVASEGSINPILHYLEVGSSEDISFNPLFDLSYFHHYSDLDLTNYPSPVEGVLAHLNGSLGPFSPFVDLDFIAATHPKVERAKLAKLLLSGALNVDQPHPLFDVAFIRARASREIENLRDAVNYYWTCGTDLATHILFNVSHYKQAQPTQTDLIFSVFHYLMTPNPVSPHGLFDDEFYCEQVVAQTGRIPSRPLEHFIATGQALGLSPSPFFDVSFYREQSGCGVDAVQHYLSDGHRRTPPHPMIAQRDMMMIERTIQSTGLSVAERLAVIPDTVPMALTPEFSPRFHSESNLNKTATAEQLRADYFTRGFLEGQRPNDLLSIPYIKAQARALGIAHDDETSVRCYFTQGWHQRTRVILALTHLDDCAANRAWLALCRSQLTNSNIEIVLIAGQAGVLSSAFCEVAHVWDLSQDPSMQTDTKKLMGSTGELNRVLKPRPGDVALLDANSGVQLVTALSGLDVPKIAFGADALADMDPDDIDAFARRVDLILCQSKDRMEIIQSAITPPAPLVRAGFHTRVQHAAKSGVRSMQVRLMLGLPESATLVVASGTQHIEAGSDLFGSLAARYLAQPDFNGDVFFLWHGQGVQYRNTPTFYAQHFVRTVSEPDRLLMTDNMQLETLLNAADIYVKICRDGSDLDDVIAAQSAGVPVILSSNHHSAKVLAQAGGVSLVEAFDLSAANAALNDLVDHPEKRTVLGTNGRGAVQTGSDLMAFVQRVNTAISDVGAKVKLNEPIEVRHGEILLVLTDEAMFGILATLDQKNPEECDQVTLDWDHLDADILPDSVLEIIHKTQCAKLTVLRSAKHVTLETVLNFDYAIWLAKGDRGELNDLYLKGQFFNDIYLAKAGLSDDLARMNPKLADACAVLNWKQT